MIPWFYGFYVWAVYPHFDLDFNDLLLLFALRHSLFTPFLNVRIPEPFDKPGNLPSTIYRQTYDGTPNRRNLKFDRAAINFTTLIIMPLNHQASNNRAIERLSG